MQRHVPMVLTVQAKFSDKVADVPVAVRRHVPMVLQTVQTTVEVLHVQFSDKVGVQPCCATSCPHRPYSVENCGRPAVALH